MLGWLDSWTFSLFNPKKKKKQRLTNSNFRENPEGFYLFIYLLLFFFLRKMKEKEVEKKLSNEYEPLFIPKGL